MSYSQFTNPYNMYYPQNSYNRNSYNNENLCNYRLKVNGAGSVKVKPNIGIVTLGVITEGKDLKEIQKENSLISTKVLEALYSLGILKKDINTESYNIDIIYDYVEGKQIFKGYKVKNILRIIIRDINKIGEIVDFTVESGANYVGDIKFNVSDISKYYNEALIRAIKDAVKKAEVIESTLPISVNKTPVRIMEQLQNTTPIPKQVLLKEASYTTPIMEGEIEVNANIEAIFVYKDYVN